MSDYLWDRSGAADPEVERLEHLLARYRGAEVRSDAARAFAIPAPRSWFRPPVLAAAALAVTVAIALALTLLIPKPTDTGMQFTATAGAPRVNGAAAASGALQLGQRLETGAGDSAKLRVAEIGWLEVGPGSAVSLLENSEGRRRLRLERGTVAAQISAPPGVFVVETPSARAIDLGCAYTLSVSPSGEGEIQVTAGWVEMDFGYVQSLVPAGYAARVAPGGNISPPYAQQTSSAFREALLAWWSAKDAAPRRAALKELLARAEKPDAYTLLSMFRWAQEDERAALFDRLNVLVPAPPEVSRTEVLAGTRNATAAWWPEVQDELGISLLKKKGPLRLGPYFGPQ
jgi:ferric-dicitrate binding protein FerR (iron transport regulator)